MNKTINIDGVEYNLVPVLPAQEATKEKKIKYRKNGALVCAPKNNTKYYFCDVGFRACSDVWKKDRIEWGFLQQGLVFDNEKACQLWADKMKVAYALKQRIVESESQDEYLEYCVICWNTVENKKDYYYSMFDLEFTVLLASTTAKDILMSDDVSDEDFKNFIKVFSL